MKDRQAIRKQLRARRRAWLLAWISAACLGVGTATATLFAKTGSLARTEDASPGIDNARPREQAARLQPMGGITARGGRPQDSAHSTELTIASSESSATNDAATNDAATSTIEPNTVPTTLPSVPSPPPVAYQSSVDRFLDRLNTLGFPRQQQGVMFVSLDGLELAGHQPGLALPAASITKLATSLAALEIWGPTHRFRTRVYTTGEVRDRVLYGDLIVVGGGDPYFVWEDSFAIGSQIARLGIRHVTGDLKVVGPFYMNYYDNRDRSAELLRWGMHQSLWPQEARTQFVKWTLRHPLRSVPNLSFSGDIVTAAALPEEASLLVEHESAPLTSILKALNSYSNNAMADILARQMGGLSVMRQTVAPLVPSGEMQVETASGLGRGNQFSSRAVVELLMALSERATAAGLQLEDWLPVVGEDPGTLRRRTAPAGTAAKSGTLNSVATLAGILPDRTYFVLLNQGWDLATIRDQQDRLLREMLQVSVDLDSLKADASN